MNRRRAISRPASLRPVWSEDGSALYFLIGGDLKCVPMADGIPGQVEIVGSALKFGMNVIEDGTLYDIDKDERVVMIRGRYRRLDLRVRSNR